MAGGFALRALGKGSVASVIGAGLALLWWLLWAAAVVVGLGAVAYCVFLVLVETGVIDPASLEGARPGVGTSALPPVVSWHIVTPALLAAAVAVAGGIVIVGRLRRLFASFTSGEPFRKENAQHLRVIWIALLVVELSRFAILLVIGGLFAVFHPPGTEDLNIEIKIDLSTWASILILIVLAEVFREGARMREEQDLTI